MRNLPEDWNSRPEAPVAIWGNGVTGKGVSELLDHLNRPYEIFDEKEKNFNPREAKRCSMVISSPGFPLSHPWMKEARNLGLAVMSETDFASCFISNPIVAITGTNGKTTLTTFLCHLWRKMGKSAEAAGNLGTPLSSLIANGIKPSSTVFLEVSSFQAQTLKALKPSVVLWTNFAPDHLDHHQNLNEYFLAKANLLKMLESPNFSMCGKSVLEFASAQNLDLQVLPMEITRESIPEFLKRKPCFLNSYPQLENLAIAYAYARKHGVNDSIFAEAVQSYQPQAHRLHQIARMGEVSFWNDSKSTNFASTIAAFKNFREKVMWIGGGREKGEKIEDLADVLPSHVAHAFLIGEVARRFSGLLEKRRVAFTLCPSLKDAVHLAFKKAKKMAHVLFSPGFASFDMFDDYVGRGNFFNQVVFDLKNCSAPFTQERSI